VPTYHAQLATLVQTAGTGRKAVADIDREGRAEEARTGGGEEGQGEAEEGLAEKTVKNIRTTLRTILGFAVKWGYLDRMPEIPDVTVPEPSFDWYRPVEVRRLLSGARDEWARAVLLFAVHTGVRMASSGRCAGRTSISRRGSSRSGDRPQVVGGGAEPQEQPLQTSRPHLGARPGAGEDPARRRARLLQPGRIEAASGQFHEILWAAQRRCGLRRIKWHELRHSFASILTTGGAPLRVALPRLHSVAVWQDRNRPRIYGTRCTLKFADV
jgi:hypothetical protein